MDLTLKNKELTTIHNEYKGFFNRWELKLSHTAVPQSDDYFAKTLARRQSQITVTTHENSTFSVSVDLHGWFVVNGADNKSYETFEMLMNSLSPHFRQHFGNELARRLEALQHHQP